MAWLAQGRSHTVLAPITLSLGKRTGIRSHAQLWSTHIPSTTPCLRHLFVRLSLKHTHTSEDLTFFSVVHKLPESFFSSAWSWQV